MTLGQTNILKLMSKRTAIFSLAPHDRHNYGDILYGNLLNKLYADKDVDFYYVGLVDIDMTELGGGVVIPVSKMIEISKIYTDVTIYVGGGEFLNSAYGGLKSFIDNNLKKSIDRTLRYPFMVDKSLFDSDINLSVKFISFGGVMPNAPQVAKLFNEGDIVYARDSLTSFLVKEKGVKNVKTFPDLGQFTREILNLESLTNDLFDDYVVIQVGKAKFESKEVLKNEIIKLSEVENVILLPVAYCNEHDDDKILAELEKEINLPNVKLFKDKNIINITKVIANSNMCIGTSLHLMMVANSYGVKYLPLNSVKKIDRYQNTWHETKVKCNENNLFEKYKESINKEYKFFEKYNVSDLKKIIGI
jgi:hypothetical protein